MGGVITQRSHSDYAETYFITKLKLTAGALQFTSRLEGMIKDIQRSTDYVSKFEQYYKNSNSNNDNKNKKRKINYDFIPKVLTCGFWLERSFSSARELVFDQREFLTCNLYHKHNDLYDIAGLLPKYTFIQDEEYDLKLISLLSKDTQNTTEMYNDHDHSLTCSFCDEDSAFGNYIYYYPICGHSLCHSCCHLKICDLIPLELDCSPIIHNGEQIQHTRLQMICTIPNFIKFICCHDDREDTNPLKLGGDIDIISLLALVSIEFAVFNDLSFVVLFFYVFVYVWFFCLVFCSATCVCVLFVPFS